jgi:hypothetical protein
MRNNLSVELTRFKVKDGKSEGCFRIDCCFQ